MSMKAVRIRLCCLGVVMLLPMSCSQAPARYGVTPLASKDSEAKVSKKKEGSSNSQNENEASDQSESKDTVDTKTEENKGAPMELPVPEAKPKFIPCIEQSEACHPHRMILADYAMGRVLSVNLDHPDKEWILDVPGGCRDLQLIGDNKLLVGTVENSQGPHGWHEVDLDTGKILKSVTGITGPVMSVQRLANGHTLLIGPNLLGGQGAVFVEVDDSKAIVSKRQFPGNNFRTVRRSGDGHVFVGNGSLMVEYTADGQEVWKSDVGAQPAYMALKKSDGTRVVASGHGGKLLTYDAKTGILQKTVSLPNIDKHPNPMPAFASAFAILPNGNYVSTNWAGSTKDHGSEGPQVSEYTPDGKLVWSWKQDASKISSVYAVLVLDNLDLSKMHDDSNGALAPGSLSYP